MRRVRTLKSQCLLYTVFPTASPSSSSASLHGGDGLRSMVAPQPRGGAARAAPAAPQRPLPAGGRCRTQDHNPTVTGSRRDRDRITTGL